MANAIARFTIVTASRTPASYLESELAQPATAPRIFMRRLMNILKGMLLGTRPGAITLEIENATTLTKSSLAGTFTGIPTADGTITIGGVVLTAKAAPATESEFDQGADANEAGDNLAAAINAHSALKGLVTATSDGAGVVTIACAVDGRIGNLITVADALANFTLAGGATKLSGAVATQQAANVTFDFGGP